MHMKVRDVVNAAISSATEELFPELTAGSLDVQSQQTMLEEIQNHERQAKIYCQAIRATHEFGKLTTKSVLLMLFDYEINQYYRFESEPFNSLEEAAVELFSNNYEDKDYILRMCGTVKQFLIPAHTMRLKTDSGVDITAEALVEMTNVRTLKEVPHHFRPATTEQKELIIRAILKGDTYNKTKNEIKDIVEDEPELMPNKVQYTFKMFQLDEGYRIEAIVKDNELYRLQTIFEGIARFEMDTSNASL